MAGMTTSTSGPVIGIHHVSIGVHDVPAAIDFYGLLGLSVDQSRPDFGVGGAWLKAGDQQVHLIETAIATPGIENHFAFIVTDLDAALALLTDHGIGSRRGTYRPGAGRQAFVRDPSGNVVELNQRDARSSP